MYSDFDALVDVASARNLLVYDYMAAPGVFTPRLIHLLSTTLSEQVTDIYLSSVGFFSFLGEKGLTANQVGVKNKDGQTVLRLDPGWDADVGYFIKRLRDEHKIVPVSINNDCELLLAVSIPGGMSIEQMSKNAYEWKNRIVLGSY